MFAAAGGTRRAAVQCARQRAAGRPYASAPAAAVGDGSDGWRGQLVKVERRPFPRFQISHDAGTDEVMHQCKRLQSVAAELKEAPSVERLDGLAAAFLEANVARDRIQAMEAWRKRVLGEFGGDAQAITQVAGVCKQVSRDGSLAHALYKVAAEEGHVEAAFQYGVLLNTRQLVLPNGPSVGKEIIERLAQLKHPESQVVVANYCLQRRRYREAIELLHQAAEHSGVAAFKLGEVYRKAAPPDYTAAEHWYGRAAELGNCEGYFMLGNMRMRGDASAGVPDYESAFHMYEWAAAAGHVESQYNVGACYMEGRGVERSPSLAAEYWRMAAVQQFPMALLRLGKLLLEDKGDPRSLRQAQDLLHTALECSDSDDSIRSEATELLGRLDKAQPNAQCTIL